MANKLLSNLNLSVGEVVSASLELQTRVDTATNLRAQLVFFDGTDTPIAAFDGNNIDDFDDYQVSPDVSGPWFKSKIEGVVIPAGAVSLNLGYAYDSANSGTVIASRKPVLNRGTKVAPYIRPSNDLSGTTVSNIGIENLISPGADRILFWDQSYGATDWLDYDSNDFVISGKTLKSAHPFYISSTDPGAVPDGALWFDTSSNPTIDADTLDGLDSTAFAQLSGANFTGSLTVNGNQVWHAGNDGSGSGLDADTVDGYQGNALANNTHTAKYASVNLPAGWYTIAISTGSNRAIARFGVRDVAGGYHQSIVFYATHVYGTGNTINVLDHAYYNGYVPVRHIRIKESSTYDGAALQVYVQHGSNDLGAFLLGDNFQISGWQMVDWIPDSTNPGVAGDWATFGEAIKVDLSGLGQGGAHFTGNVVLAQDSKIEFLGSTPSYLTDEQLVFGWGGGWYMSDDTWIRAWGDKPIYTGASQADAIKSNGGFSLSSGHGKGLRFWDSDTYKIYMSSAASEPYGCTELFTGADYNMYFRMGGSSNTRGWVFWNGASTSTASAQITGDGYLYLRSGLRFGQNSSQLLSRSGEFLRWANSYGNIDIGPNNSYYCHFYTSLPGFYFSKEVQANGGFRVYSDIRLKENVREIEVKDLSAIKPKLFDWKDGRKKGVVGYIAQEVQELAPEVVEEGNDGYLSLDIDALLTLKVQSLEAKIEELERKLNELSQ